MTKELRRKASHYYAVTSFPVSPSLFSRHNNIKVLLLLPLLILSGKHSMSVGTSIPPNRSAHQRNVTGAIHWKHHFTLMLRAPPKKIYSVAYTFAHATRIIIIYLARYVPKVVHNIILHLPKELLYNTDIILPRISTE